MTRKTLLNRMKIRTPSDLAGIRARMKRLWDAGPVMQGAYGAGPEGVGVHTYIVPYDGFYPEQFWYDGVHLYGRNFAGDYAQLD